MTVFAPGQPAERDQDFLGFLANLYKIKCILTSVPSNTIMPHLLKSYISYVAFLEEYHAHSDPLPRTLLFTNFNSFQIFSGWAFLRCASFLVKLRNHAYYLIVSFANQYYFVCSVCCILHGIVSFGLPCRQAHSFMGAVGRGLCTF